METFKEFLDKQYLSISEAAKTPLDIKWIKTTKKWSGEFIIDDVKFDIIISKSNEYCDEVSIWEFKFTRDNSTKMTNDLKYPFSVVPTIKSAMEEFIANIRPEIIGFVGNKDDNGRVKMYQKNAKIYSDKFNYKFYENSESDYCVFVLYTDNKFEDCARSLVEK